MDPTAIRAIIDRTVSSGIPERFTTLARDEAQELFDFLMAYARTAAELLESLPAGRHEQAAWLLGRLTDCWDRHLPPPGHEDELREVVSCAYVTNRLFEHLAAAHGPTSDSAFLIVLESSNRVVRMVLGDVRGDVVEREVEREWDEELQSTGDEVLSSLPKFPPDSLPGLAPPASVPPGILADPLGRPKQAAATPPAKETRSSEPARVYTVWYATNRARREGDDGDLRFGDERNPDGRVSYGTCEVEIPRTHQFGSIGRPWWRRWLELEFHDDHLRLVDVYSFSSPEEFFSKVREELEALDADLGKHALVYLHGYNVSFDEAAIRAAQMGFDLKVSGITAFFSWPSTADVQGYFADQERIEASEREIADFLVRMARESGAEAVHIIAHSMGNRGLARAVQRITSRAADLSGVRFGQIILAAPDVSVDLFRDLAAVYPTLCERTTMYTSARDRALAMSKFLQDADRAGFTPPVTVVGGIDTVEVTDIDVTILGHGYYAEAEPVLYDIAQLLHTNAAPRERPRLREVRAEDGSLYWQIGA